MSCHGIEFNQCRPQVKWFAVEIEKLLRKNDYKGDWRRLSLKFLRNKLDEEVKEFEKAITRKDMLYEITDVACVAMMIADIINIYEEEKNEKLCNG
jgi:NTP pyrophosphatase (non-canonical NTP hydrolase)